MQRQWDSQGEWQMLLQQGMLKDLFLPPLIFVNQEYGGEKCDQCSGNHYESFRDETKLLCSPCHKVKHLQFCSSILGNFDILGM